MPVSDFEDMMPDTLSHSELIGHNSYGEPTYGSPVTLQCRLTYDPTKVIDSLGEEVVSKATAWVSSVSLSIDPDDEFTTSFGETLYVITSSRIQDEGGVHHHKIFFK